MKIKEVYERFRIPGNLQEHKKEELLKAARELEKQIQIQTKVNLKDISVVLLDFSGTDKWEKLKQELRIGKERAVA